MSERKTLSEWLRDEAVYRPQEAADPDAERAAAGNLWRAALLTNFEHGPAVRRARSGERASVPLSPHHLAVLAPLGVGLFLLGWLVGSGQLDFGRLATVPPLVWAGLTAAGSIGWVLWRGVGSRRSP